MRLPGAFRAWIAEFWGYRPMPPSAARYLLWLDCGAAALAGTAVLLLGSWLSELYRVAHELLMFVGVVNLLYACYSFSLAVRDKRPRSLLYGLVGGNALWAVICMAMALRLSNSASLFAQAYLMGEALFVGALAMCEWRWRELILVRI
ncbi:hypothetical protein AAFN46_05540 [Pseudomonas sp. CAU 1711]|uniref:hypothetical protein n=1 Tax=Pseudomonas sp. CAU 1711 TaxID=3140356 RepID=UPI00326189F7